jgi:cysteinyl-tRNA synthetase
MWPFNRTKTLKASTAPVFFTNTLSGKKEVFVPFIPGFASLYSCGPTVYSKQHIGNLKAPLFADLVARVLSSAGYRVRRVINITDVGHLVGDGDEGEDKMIVGSLRENKSAKDVAAHYTKLFQDDLRALHFDTNDILFPFATQYIQEQISMIQTLEKKGVTYRIRDGLYFDTSTFPRYGMFGTKNDRMRKEVALSDMGHRIAQNVEKRNPQDFALWKFSPAGVVRQQEWPSPWGRGFPGWHIECSAMVRALLGVTIDIHTGGMDHIPVHHTNEIAQSETANGKPLARYWMHEAFVTLADEKISKSLSNEVYLSDIVARGIHPLALRYFFLQSHYRSPISFTWEALAAASEALTRLWRLTLELKIEANGIGAESTIRERVITYLRDDISTPQALALLWETVRDEDLSPRVRWGVILAAEEVFGLCLTEPPHEVRALSITDLPHELQMLVSERVTARAAGEYARADELRIHIQSWGYAVDDSPSGQSIRAL